MSWLSKVTKFNFLPGEGNGRFYVFSDQFNKLIEDLKSVFPGSGQLSLAAGSSTSPGVAHTINAPMGDMLVTHGAVVPGASRTVTLTNSYVEADSIVMASIDGYGGTGNPVIGDITVSAGQVVIEIDNVASSGNLSANFTVNFIVFNRI